MYKIEEYPFIEEELNNYYIARDRYKNQKSVDNQSLAVMALRELFFALKGYSSLGYITPQRFEEMIDYFEEDIND